MSIQRAPADFELSQDGGIWVATHVDTGVASQADTPNEAVSMAKEAVQLQQRSHHAGDEAHQNAMLEVRYRSGLGR
jgi:hypothetical protein